MTKEENHTNSCFKCKIWPVCTVRESGNAMIAALAPVYQPTGLDTHAGHIQRDIAEFMASRCRLYEEQEE